MRPGTCYRLDGLRDSTTRGLARQLKTGYLVAHGPSGAVASTHADPGDALSMLERVGMDYCIMPAHAHDGSVEAAWRWCSEARDTYAETYAKQHGRMIGLAHAGTLRTMYEYNAAMRELNALATDVPTRERVMGPFGQQLDAQTMMPFGDAVRA